MRIHVKKNIAGKNSNEDMVKNMSRIEYYKTDRDRICKFCEKPIERGEEAVIIRRIKVSPKVVDLHIHTECFKKECENL